MTKKKTLPTELPEHGMCTRTTCAAFFDVGLSTLDQLIRDGFLNYVTVHGSLKRFDNAELHAVRRSLHNLECKVEPDHARELIQNIQTALRSVQGSPKGWTQRQMDEALREISISVDKARKHYRRIDSATAA